MGSCWLFPKVEPEWGCHRYKKREGPCAGDGTSSISTAPSCITTMHLLLDASMITYPAQVQGEDVVNDSSPG